MIPRDLDHLMRKARWPEGSNTVRTMWIDQLCINQDDDNDKAQQVPLMRNIFERAASTIVWLGHEGIEDCELAFDLMERWYDKTHGLSKSQLGTMPLESILGPPTDENLRSYQALRALLEYDYWDRTWVLQEATASPTTAVWYGDVRTEGYPLAFIFYARNLIMRFVARNAPSIYGLKDTPSAKVGRVELFHLSRTDGLSHSLRELLNLVRRTTCTDPRDKVFSVVPFAADVGDYLNEPFLKPNYERRVIDVYVDVARWYICTMQNLDILGHCAARMKTDHFYLPSWVPNWTTAALLEPLPKVLDESLDSDERQPMYSACGPFSHTSQLVFWRAEGWRTNTLFLSGLCIATVRRVLEPALDAFLSLETERSWQESFNPSDIYGLTGESMLVAFQRTVLADQEQLYDDLKRRNRFQRGARLTDWPDQSNVTEYMDQTGRIKRSTRQRRLFYASAMDSMDRGAEGEGSNMHKPQDLAEDPDATVMETPGSHFIMGLGREDVQIGDQLWALKGGSVLYVPRPFGKACKINNSKVQGDLADHHNLPDQLWFNGQKRDWGEPLFAQTYHFVGEAYAHGFMDGEALEFAAKRPDERPEALRDMEEDFHEILLGMGQMMLEDEEKIEQGATGCTYHVGSETKTGQEIPASKREVWTVY